MSIMQKVILEKGIVNSVTERIELVEKYKAYKDKLKDSYGVKVFLKYTPIDLEDRDLTNLLGDRNVVELLDDNVDHFILRLSNPGTFRFEDYDEFECHMKSKYVMYVEFDMERYLGELEEKYDSFEEYLDD